MVSAHAKGGHALSARRSVRASVSRADRAGTARSSSTPHRAWGFKGCGFVQRVVHTSGAHRKLEAPQGEGHTQLKAYGAYCV